MSFTWAAHWVVVLCYPNGTLHQHNFYLSHRMARVLGADRAEKDANDFADQFSFVAAAFYVGPAEDMPPHLKMAVVENHNCHAA